MQPKLTIGMAVVNDRKGVYTTIQHMRLTNRRLEECEFIVVDNKPGFSPQSEDIRRYLAEKVDRHGNCGARYIPMAEPTGTAPPRNRVFAEARGAAVLCVDSHILTDVGAIDRLLEWYDSHPETDDLYSGPIRYDSLQDTETHFDDIWRSAMWGVWGRAWACACLAEASPTAAPPLHFTVRPQTDGQVVYLSLTMSPQPVTDCPRCGRKLPALPHQGHRPALQQLGYHLLGSSPDEAPFEVPGQGLGLFSCRRAAWLGFHEHFRQFGGEEMYIHEKFRQAGRRCVNLPFLGWNHDFWKPPGSSYPLTNWGKIRNYVLGHQELGLSLEPVYRHFVEGRGMSDDERSNYTIAEKDWLYLISDPIGHTRPPRTASGCNGRPGCGGAKPARPQPPEETKNIPDLIAWCKSVPRDLDQHLDKLAELAGQCQHVTEISKRRESTIAMAACPGTIRAYNVERDPLHDVVQKIVGDRLQLSAKHSPLIREIEPTDLLFIDSQHTYSRLYDELTRFAPAVRRWIACHDTALYGERGEDGGPGLLHAIRRYMTEHPEWSVVYHTQMQYGLTVIGCRPEDKPQLPGVITMAANFAKAVAEHIADGSKKVDQRVYQARLETCTTCPQRVDEQCSVCGCYIAKKAEWRSAMCPLHLWKE